MSAKKKSCIHEWFRNHGNQYHSLSYSFNNDAVGICSPKLCANETDALIFQIPEMNARQGYATSHDSFRSHA